VGSQRGEKIKGVVDGQRRKQKSVQKGLEDNARTLEILKNLPKQIKWHHLTASLLPECGQQPPLRQPLHIFKMEENQN
jgi:hypothetical protein